MSGVQPVFPAGGSGSGGTGGSSPAAGAGGKGIRLGKMRLGQRELAIGGAVVVGALALFARSRSGGDTTSEDDGVTDAAGTPGGGYEIDTRATDFYNELQPELEAVSDRLDDLTGAVKQIPRTPTPAPKPAKPKPKPKPKKPKKKPPRKPKKKPPRKPPRKPRR